MRIRIQFFLTCLIASLLQVHLARSQTLVMTKTQILHEVPKSAAFGDMDQDGDLDLVLAVSNVFRVYDNQGGRLSTSPKSYYAPTINDVAVGDLNGDNWPDVVSAGTNPYVFLSDGNGGLPTRMSLSATGASRVVLADMDGDHDLDIVLGGGSYDGSTQVYSLITIYTNQGGAFTLPPMRFGQGHTDAIAVGDLDGDGDLDIVSAGNPQGGLPGDAEVYRNDGGSFQLVWSTSFAGGGGGFNDVDLCDMNNDGYLDMVLSSAELQAFANQKNTNIFADYASGPTWSHNAGSGIGTVLGDIDMDGTIDLASIGSSRLEILTAPNGNSWANTAFSVQSQGLGTVLADIDGDGDLDLIAEDDVDVALYINQSEMSQRMFGSYATFTAAPGTGGAVELGDVNGDGHLDLLRGIGSGERAQIFPGNGNLFNYQLLWQSTYATAGFGRSVAFGDVDGDGDLDLIDQENISGRVTLNLYRNNNGQLGSPVPILPFDSEPGAIQDFALGDIDFDGDLDLVVVPYTSPSVVLLYDNGTYGPVADWTMAPSHETLRVLFGDLDRDMDSDLVFLNTLPFLNDEIYMSNEGVLGNAPDFSPSVTLSPGARALGDMNQDGWPDLVVSDGSLNLYLNNRGIGVDPFRAWTSPAPHEFVTLADMDGDGDLDVVAGAGSGQSPGVYANTGGLIDRQPAWTWNVSAGYHAVTTGDIDEDGDADLVLDPYVFQAARLPAYKGDPVQPTRQLPNNGAFLRHVRMTPDAVAEDEYNVSWTCYDVESDRVRIVMDYHFEGDSLWSAPVATSPWFEASPAGVSGQLHWDAGDVPLDPRPVELRLHLAESPTRVSVIQHAAPYLKPVGRLLAHRPMVRWLSEFSFPGTTTLGDTTIATATFKNLGSRDLIVSQVVLPPSDMWLATTLPVVVPPRQAAAISVAAAPASDADISGEITLTTNDPGAPTAHLAAFGKVTGLVISHELVTPVDTLALGQAVTVLVIPAPSVHVENGTVFYRTRGETTYDAVPLSSFGSNWIANIPGEGIREPGLEYYIQVENTPAFGTDPLNEAELNPYFRAVHAPSEVTTTAVPTAGQDYLSGRSIEILVSLPQGSVFQSGLLHYHAGGEQMDHVDTLLTDTNLPSGTIDESVVGARGIEYWVEVKTGTRDLTDPPANPSSNPRRIQITVPEVTEPAVHAGKRYRMVSFPIEFGESFTGTIEDILTDEKGMGEYNTERWRSWVWVTDKNGYGELSDRTVAYLFRPKPGRAYWLVTKDEHQVDTGPVAGRSTSTDEPYELTIKPGWTMIGDPFAFDVAWSAVMSDTTAASEDPRLSGPYAYTGSGYRREDRLKPFSGYWVHNEDANAVVLRVPPTEAPEPVAFTTSKIQRDGWTVSVTARCAGHTAGAEFGVSSLARDGRDTADELLPPMSPGDGISVYAAGEEPRIRDIRSVSTWRTEGGITVPFDLTKNFTVDRSGDEATVSFDLGQLPSGQHAILVDRKLGLAINLRETSNYTFIAGQRSVVSGSGETRLTLLIGTNAYLQSRKNLVPGLPAKTTLHQNAPNPFNPVTVIRYDLAAPSDVSLRIYDLKGALVRNLVRGNKPAGRYEVGWNGENERGEKVASGVYFYELRAGGFRQARKMVLLK